MKLIDLLNRIPAAEFVRVELDDAVDRFGVWFRNGTNEISLLGKYLCCEVYSICSANSGNPVNGMMSYIFIIIKKK